MDGRFHGADYILLEDGLFCGFTHFQKFQMFQTEGIERFVEWWLGFALRVGLREGRSAQGQDREQSNEWKNPEED